MRDEVYVDVPRPVADDDHQGQDEEEDEEVRGLGVAAVKEAEHGEKEYNAKSDVQIPARTGKFCHVLFVQILWTTSYFHFPFFNVILSGEDQLWLSS